MLLVDDNAVVRDVLERILRMNGYDVVAVASGEEAVAMYRALSAAVDLVLLDMCMPGMDGYDTYRELRGIRADVRVILCSGSADPTRVERALADGVFAFLGKPFTPSQVTTLVDAAVGRKVDTAPPPSPRVCPSSKR
ncbi:MAG: response regulator [Deltaproteobacteria bacterium]|nr:response regulator [Deltaproteobacteria bacterium]